jgi:hypothetical protein
VVDLWSTDACTLPTAARPLRLAEFDALFATSAREVARDEHDVRIHLVGAAGLRAQVVDLVAREQECCSFFTFSVEGGEEDLTLGISVPEQRRSILDALADRAEELSA